MAPKQRRLSVYPRSATWTDSAGDAGRGPSGLAVQGRGGAVAGVVAGGGRKRWGRPHAPAPGRSQRSESAGSRATLHFAWVVESAHRDLEMTSAVAGPCTARGAKAARPCHKHPAICRLKQASARHRCGETRASVPTPTPAPARATVGKPRRTTHGTDAAVTNAEKLEPRER